MSTAGSRYVEAPQPYRYDVTDPVAVLMAGGISNCPDWQAVAAKTLLDAGLIVLNPRRASFRPDDPDAAAVQVAWEYTHLNGLPRLLTLFWFPATDPAVTVQPIALLELGRATASPSHHGRHLVVGADPGYPRRVDVELQLRNSHPGLVVYDNLDATVQASLVTAEALTAEPSILEVDVQAWGPYDEHRRS